MLLDLPDYLIPIWVNHHAHQDGPHPLDLYIKHRLMSEHFLNEAKTQPQKNSEKPKPVKTKKEQQEPERLYFKEPLNSLLENLKKGETILNGAVLKDLLTKRKINSATFAHACGTTLKQVENWQEEPLTVIPTRLFHKIVQILRLTPEEQNLLSEGAK